MADNTGISWTDATWNVVTGCAKVSAACKNCYAERDWARLVANPKTTVYHGRKFTDVMCHPERLDQPLRWTRPRHIFVNAMSDLFHEAVPLEFIDQVVAIIGLAYVMDRGHTFQVLTKRPQRMNAYFNDPDTPWRVARAMKVLGPALPGENSPPTWPLPNLHLGVSVEHQTAADERLTLLVGTEAAYRFISMEPLLGPVSISPWLANLDAVIVGGESGPNARPTHPQWATEVRDECATAGVPFIFKQWGEWAPRSSCYHVLTNGEAAADQDPSATKWPCIRLTYAGLDGRNLANATVDGDDVYMQRVGLRLAGRLLHGVLHDSKV